MHQPDSHMCSSISLMLFSTARADTLVCEFLHKQGEEIDSVNAQGCSGMLQVHSGKERCEEVSGQVVF